MRILPILLPDGSLDNDAHVAIQSCMLFPDDPDSVKEDLLAYRLYKQHEIPNRRLLKRQDDEWRAALPGGLFAGSMLMLMVQFDVYFPEMKVGMNKSAFANAAAAKSFDRKLSKDASTMKKYWAYYKNAAHLWAAFMSVVGRFGEPETGNLRKFPVDFLHVIGLAEQLSVAALHLVDTWDPWRVPEQPDFPRRLFSLPRPHEKDVRLVRSYRSN